MVPCIFPVKYMDRSPHIQTYMCVYREIFLWVFFISCKSCMDGNEFKLHLCRQVFKFAGGATGGSTVVVCGW